MCAIDYNHLKKLLSSCANSTKDVEDSALKAKAEGDGVFPPQKAETDSAGSQGEGEADCKDGGEMEVQVSQVMRKYQ